MSLGSFEKDLKQKCIRLLWSHWAAIGVRGKSAETPRVVVDPEALLILTWSVGREDPRLFDTVLAWTLTNSEFLDMTRLEGIAEDAPPEVKSIAAAWACHLVNAGQSDWARLDDESLESNERRALFVRDSDFVESAVYDEHFARYGWLRGRVSAQTGSTTSPGLSHATGARLVLRKLMGTNARAEVFVGVLFGSRFFTRDIANTAGYSKRSVQLLLHEFEQAGFVQLLQEPGRPTQGWPTRKAQALKEAVFESDWETIRWYDTISLSLVLADIWQITRKIRQRNLGDYPAESLLRDGLSAGFKRLRRTRTSELPNFDVGTGKLAALLEGASQLVDSTVGALVGPEDAQSASG